MVLNLLNSPSGPYRVWADDEGPGIAMTRTLGDLQGFNKKKKDCLYFSYT